MAIAQMRKSSQITIPFEIKKQLHVKEGDYLEFVYDNGRAYIEPVTVSKRSDTTDKFYEFLSGIHKITEPKASQVEGDWNEYINDIIKEVRASK